MKVISVRFVVLSINFIDIKVIKVLCFVRKFMMLIVNKIVESIR